MDEQAFKREKCTEKPTLFICSTRISLKKITFAFSYV